MKEQLKNILKALGIYHPLQTACRSSLSHINSLYYRVTYLKYKGNGFTCNFCGASYSKFVPNYPSKEIARAIYGNKVIAGAGDNVFCPKCMCKNRERLVKDVVQHYLKIENKKILHFSPEKHLFGYLKKTALVTTVDITPGFYKNIDRGIVYANATNLQFSDEYFDVLIANHILEHIPEDLKAMKEMCRVLKNDGVAILQVPYSETLETTIEDPYISDPAKQAELYGQKDHVRIYALKDYVNRLKNAGFDVRVIPPELLTPFKIHAIQEGESVVICYKMNIKDSDVASENLKNII